LRFQELPSHIDFSLTVNYYEEGFFPEILRLKFTPIFMLYALKLTVIALVTVPLTVLTLVLGLLDPHGKYVYRINQLWCWMILRIAGISVKIAGLNHIDPNQKYVFMVNHQSNIDIPVLINSLHQFQLRLIAKKELLRVPFFGWAMWASKHITIDRTNPLGAVKTLQRAKERIAAGISVVVFPEGTRSRDGKLLRFKKGGFRLAVQTGTAIVPVTINGSGALLPSGAWRLQSGTIEVTLGQPITVEGYQPGNLRLLSEQVRERIAEHLRPMARSPAETTLPPSSSPARRGRNEVGALKIFLA
jgi:1-acyl-sn-glycerol-3-phosphate acyltransferase